MLSDKFFALSTWGKAKVIYFAFSYTMRNVLDYEIRYRGRGLMNHYAALASRGPMPGNAQWMLFHVLKSEGYIEEDCDQPLPGFWPFIARYMRIASRIL